ncbi:MAG: hypothetical protein J6S85_23560 [Methanobrevibacter sp.]|nr:hypothetical protein [Methanobrevibacter sp.]
MGSDKSFMYELDATETWKNLQLFADGDLPWSQRKEYGNNVRKAIVN